MNKVKTNRLTSVILCLIAFNFTAHTQDFEFTLYYSDPCTSQVELALIYSLEKDGIEFESDFDGVVHLKEKGKYNLIIDRESRPIYIAKKQSSDTISSQKISEFILTHDKHGYKFRDCESPLNGNIIDYFDNGNVRLIGSFKNGLAIGYITEFYGNGDLKQIRYFDKNGYLQDKVVFE